ncbi:hypothetical protein TNCV_1742031 [Trichonephila clavipes]|nr:hypothetical protein TNCV_1742031 [Trichonephila clavipes]
MVGKVFIRHYVALFTITLEENRPALPQFELSSPVEQYETFYKHRAGRYVTDLRIGRWSSLSREQDSAPIEAEARGPAGLRLKTSLRVVLYT